MNYLFHSLCQKSSPNQSYCFNQIVSYSVKFLIMQFFSFPLLTPTLIKLGGETVSIKPMSSPGSLGGGDGVGGCGDDVGGRGDVVGCLGADVGGCGAGGGCCADGGGGCGDGGGGLVSCPVCMML